MVLTRVRVRDITGTFGPNLVEIVSTAWLGAVCRGQGKSQDDEDETAGSMKAYPGGKAMEAIAERQEGNVGTCRVLAFIPTPHLVPISPTSPSPEWNNEHRATPG